PPWSSEPCTRAPRLRRASLSPRRCRSLLRPPWLDLRVTPSERGRRELRRNGSNRAAQRFVHAVRAEAHHDLALHVEDRDRAGAEAVLRQLLLHLAGGALIRLHVLL